MKIFSKIKHLDIGSKAIGLFRTGRYKLNNLSKNNKRLLATGLTVVTLGSAAVTTSSVVKNHDFGKNTDNSLVMENDLPTDTNEDVIGPKLNGEISTDNKEDKKDEKKDEFLSDKLEKVEIKDEEDKKNEEVKQEINGSDENTITVDENTVVGYVAYQNPDNNEIIERVEYTGDGIVVDGVAYETLEDANRYSQVGNIEFVDNTQYYPGANGEYYLTQEDADNSYKVEYYENNDVVENEEVIENNEVVEEIVDDEINITDGFYWDEENQIRWASYEDYLIVNDPSYILSVQEADYTDEIVEETEVTEEVNDVDITDEFEEIVYGPDGEIYPSLEAYNEAMAKTVEETVVENEPVIEIVEETEPKIWEPVEETNEETKEEKTEVKEETKTEVKEEVVEETKEETKTEVKEEKTEVKEETKEEVTEEVTASREYSDEYLDELLSDEGWIAPNGDYWTSEEEYLLVLNQNEEMTAKTR